MQGKAVKENEEEVGWRGGSDSRRKYKLEEEYTSLRL